MTEYFFSIFNRNGVCLWRGTTFNETAAWKAYKIESNTPDAIPVEKLTEGRYGLRICQWEL